MKAIDNFRGEYRWLSNFYPGETVYEGMVFCSTEAAYQAAKTNDLRLRIPFTSMTPGEAKKAGKKLPLREDWEAVKLGVMEELLHQKFFDGSLLAEKLVGTGEALLQEGNWWGDTFWGVCRGKGENHLGKLLMKIRGELQKESSPPSRVARVVRARGTRGGGALKNPEIP